MSAISVFNNNRVGTARNLMANQHLQATSAVQTMNPVNRAQNINALSTSDNSKANAELDSEDVNTSAQALQRLNAALTVNTAPTFSAPDGKVIVPVGSRYDEARSVIQQADGRLVVAGYSASSSGSSLDFSLIRLNADGSLDPSFDGDGKVIIPAGSSHNYGYSVIQQSDGKLVVAGTSASSSGSSGNDFSLIRLNADGSLDTSFDGDGKVIIPVISNRDDYGYSGIQQSDGKLVVAGYSTIGYGNADFSLIRLNADGSLDTSFDGDGKVIVPVGAYDDQGYSVIQQADGKLVVAGISESDFSLIRLNADGSLDTSFDGDGKVILVASGWEEGRSVIQQTDGKLVVAGRSSSGVSLIRLNADGSLDTSFDEDGKVIIPVGSGYDFGYSIIQQADGKLVMAGTSSGAFSLIRLNADGSLDTSFDGDGKVITPVGHHGDQGYSVIQQADGKLVVAGTSSGAFSLIRLNADGSLDTSFSLPENTLGNTVFFGEPSNSWNFSPVTLARAVHIFDVDLFAAGNYNGASVTLSRQGGAHSNDVFSSSTSGSMTALIQGAYFSVDNITIGRVTTNSAGVLTLVFNTNATQYLVDMALRQIAYGNTSNAPPASVVIDWIFHDGNTGSQGTGGALSVTASTTVTIYPFNEAPVNAVVVSDQTARVGAPFVMALPVGAFTDPDGDTLSYGIAMTNNTALPPWLSINTATGMLSGTPDALDVGTFTIRFTAADPGQASASDTFVLTVAPFNAAPVLNTPASITFTDSSAQDIFIQTSGTLIGQDADNATLAYGITGGSPANTGFVSKAGVYGSLMVNVASGAYTFFPSDTAIQGLSSPASETFTVTVSDGIHTAQASLLINISAVNDSPTLSNLPTTVLSITVGTAAALADFAVADADGNALTVTLDPVNGTIGGLLDDNPLLTGIQLTGAATSINTALAGATFTATASGAASIAISVTDGFVATPTSGTYRLTAVAPNQAPSLGGVPVSAQNIATGTTVDLADFTVADADGNTLTVTLTSTNGSIGGLIDANPSLAGIQLTGTATSINTALAGATFTATAAGAASIGISVTDGIVASPTTGTYSFNVTNVNAAPTLSGVPATVQPITVGTAAALTDFMVADSDGNALTVTLDPVNGTIGGLFDANPSLAGIQLGSSQKTEKIVR